MYDDLIKRLALDLEWAEANEWESPITLADDIREAIEEIYKYRYDVDITKWQDPNYYSTGGFNPPSYTITCSGDKSE